MDDYNRTIQKLIESYGISKKSARAYHATQNFIAISDRQKSKILTGIVGEGRK